MMHKVKVWDWPVRVCHWALVIIILFQYLSGEFFDDTVLTNNMQWHFYAGYTCIGIVLFRICWGFLGTYYARFSQFIVSPIAALNYLKGNTVQNNKVQLGHNPAGAYSIIVLLSLILTQAISGLFISDEVFTDGPYYGLLESQGQAIANFLHHNAINVLLIFIALHIIAIVFYKLKNKQDLTKAMITGNKLSEELQQTKAFPWIGFLICILITALALYLIIEVLPPEPADDYFGY